jgi:hypothetical protein
MDTAATIAVGESAGLAAFWTASVDQSTGSRSWRGPFTLPGGCTRAMGADAAGNITGARCPRWTGSSKLTSGVWRPPYTRIALLGGLGGTDGGTVYGMAPGGLVVGNATSGQITVATIWRYVVGAVVP